MPSARAAPRRSGRPWRGARAHGGHWWRPLGPSARRSRPADSDLFELRARTADSLANLRRREAPLDVRVADVVEAGGRPASPLFLTQNHPATALLVACADRVLRVLGFSALPRGAYEDAGPNEAGIPGRVFPPCVFDRPHRIVGAAPAPVPEFYLELFDRVVREMCAGD